MLTVQWQPPVYDGWAPVDNYTITVTLGGSTVTIPGTSAMYTLSYNVMHTVSIVATNCNGGSSAVMETFRIGRLGNLNTTMGFGMLKIIQVYMMFMSVMCCCEYKRILNTW